MERQKWSVVKSLRVGAGSKDVELGETVVGLKQKKRGQSVGEKAVRQSRDKGTGSLSAWSGFYASTRPAPGRHPHFHVKLNHTLGNPRAEPSDYICTANWRITSEGLVY